MVTLSSWDCDESGEATYGTQGAQEVMAIVIIIICRQLTQGIPISMDHLEEPLVGKSCLNGW